MRLMKPRIPQYLYGLMSTQACPTRHPLTQRWHGLSLYRACSIRMNFTTIVFIVILGLPDISIANSTLSATASASPTASSSPTSKGVNSGLIAGATIGSIAVAAIIIALALLVRKKRITSKASSAPSQQYINKWSKNVMQHQNLDGGSSWGGSNGYEDGSSRGYGTPSLPSNVIPSTYHSHQHTSLHAISSHVGHKPSSQNSTQITPYVLPPVETTSTPSRASTGLASHQIRPIGQPMMRSLNGSSPSLHDSQPVHNLPTHAPFSERKRSFLSQKGSTPMRFYNPDDPSTYPPSITEGSVTQTSSPRAVSFASKQPTPPITTPSILSDIRSIASSPNKPNPVFRANSPPLGYGPITKPSNREVAKSSLSVPLLGRWSARGKGKRSEVEEWDPIVQGGQTMEEFNPWKNASTNTS